MPQTSAMLCAQKIVGLAKVRSVSDFFNLKLQKLVYYAQAWHLALHGTVLFPDPIEAWVHGPVVRGVFTRYKYGNLEACPYDPVADSHLVEVLDAYGHFAGSELERMTHSEKPWIEARAGLPPDAASKNIIQVDTMREFYSALIDA